MKKIPNTLISFGLIISFGVLNGGCTRCSPKAKGEGDAAAVVVPEKIASSLATTLCEKHSTCQTSPEFNRESCIQEIQMGINDRLKAKTDLKVSESMLDTCLNAIKAGPCELLGQETPPPECQFLE